MVLDNESFKERIGALFRYQSFFVRINSWVVRMSWQMPCLIFWKPVCSLHIGKSGTLWWICFWNWRRKRLRSWNWESFLSCSLRIKLYEEEENVMPRVGTIELIRKRQLQVVLLLFSRCFRKIRLTFLYWGLHCIFQFCASPARNFS